ncbi:hypothetical protein GpartN1_g4171.t1 [Galdieria partita]|uniref:Uncharacterized protein n=1 Tax=Galdieria partita TaxID=83374 RepID=A0A9C7PXS6_9RHOD|nr:hypothetical protein GpartN1_g4171.t1 [Galdieria partita]
MFHFISCKKPIRRVVPHFLFVTNANKHKSCIHIARAIIVAACVAKLPSTKQRYQQQERILFLKGKKLSEEVQERISNSLRIRMAVSQIRTAQSDKQMGTFRLPLDKWRIRVPKTSRYGDTRVALGESSLSYSFCATSVSNVSHRICLQLSQYRSRCSYVNFPSHHRKLSVLSGAKNFSSQVLTNKDIPIEETSRMMGKSIMMVTRRDRKYGTKQISLACNANDTIWKPKLYSKKIGRQDIDRTLESRWEYTGFNIQNFLERYQNKQRVAKLITRQMDKTTIGLSIRRKGNTKLEKRTANETELKLYRNGIRMRKGTGGYEPLPKQSNTEEIKKKQPEKKPLNKKTSSSSDKESEPQYRRRIVAYNEDGSIQFERDLQPGEDFSVALEEWKEERSNLSSTVADAMNPELDWEQNDIQEEEQRQVKSSKRIPKWIADDVDFDDNEDETAEEEDENLFPSPKDVDLEEEDVIE